MVSVSEAAPEGDGFNKRALVVVGMHRSGTSAMTRTLSLLGASLPKKLMGPAENNNETGFWEPQRVADFNDEILEALDSEWDDVFAFRPRQYLSNFDNFYLGRAVELLDEEFNGSELIVLKDPRISVLSSFWDRVLRKAGYSAHYVIMVRNPLEVAESLRARDEFPREKSLLLWSSYMVAVDRDTRALPRTFISYDQLMSNWRAVRKRIEDEARFPFPRDTAAASIDIDRHLQRKLQHHKAEPADVFASGEVPEQTKALYRIFSDACEGAEVDASAVDAIQAELAKIDSLMGPLLADLKARSRNLARELAAEREASERRAHDHGRETEELHARRAAAEAESDRLRQEVQGLTERLRVEGQALNERLQAAAIERERIARDAEERNRRQLAELERLGTESAEARAAIAAAEGRLSGLAAEIDQLTRDLEAQRDATGRAEGEVEALEGRISDRFREIATLTRLLAEREAAEKSAREDNSWLREAGAILLADGSTRKGRLYRLLPAALNYKRQQKLLRRRGLFDASEYLAANPDVAATGVDPLRHYLKHGFSENRRRGKSGG